MKTTRYFDEQVLPRRPYLTHEMCEAVIAAPTRRKVQPDGRIRYWGAVVLPSLGGSRMLRVVTLDDGATVHNAFLDRQYREDVE